VYNQQIVKIKNIQHSYMFRLLSLAIFMDYSYLRKYKVHLKLSVFRSIRQITMYIPTSAL